MFESLIRTYGFGKRLYAHRKWWTQLENINGEAYFAIKGKEAPAKVYIVIQTDEDKKYQEILFRRFQ